MSDNHIEPQPVIDLVESYVYRELSDFAQYENRSAFDESGAWSLHRLARAVYAMGVTDGTHQELARNLAQQQRERRQAASTATPERDQGAPE